MEVGFLTSVRLYALVQAVFPLPAHLLVHTVACAFIHPFMLVLFLARSLDGLLVPLCVHAFSIRPLSSKVQSCCGVCAAALTDKEAVLFLTRLAALDNAMSAMGPSREQWQATFLDLLYTMCTKVIPPHVSLPLVLRSFLC